MKFKGIKFKFNILFLLVLFLFALSGLFTKAILTFGIIFAHELAHTFMAWKLGVSAYEIELLPFGGVVRFQDLLQLNPNDEQKIAIVGPCLNFFLVAVLLLLLRYQYLEYELAFYLLKLNLSLGIFNLLPAFPLDGGRILRAQLVKIYGFKLAQQKVLALSKSIAVILAIISIVGFYFGYANITLLIIAFFIYFVAVKSKFKADYAVMQSIIEKKNKILQQRLLEGRLFVALSETKIKEVIAILAPDCFHIIYVLDSDLNRLGLITEDKLIKVMFKEGIDFTLGEILQER